MLDIIIKVIAGIVAVAGLAVIVVALLDWITVCEWFEDHQELKESEKETIAFTMQEKLANGDYRTVQGIFSKNSNVVMDSTVYESKKVDDQLADYHRNNTLVVYN